MLCLLSDLALFSQTFCIEACLKSRTKHPRFQAKPGPIRSIVKDLGYLCTFVIHAFFFPRIPKKMKGRMDFPWPTKMKRVFHVLYELGTSLKSQVCRGLN